LKFSLWDAATAANEVSSEEKGVELTKSTIDVRPSDVASPETVDLSKQLGKWYNEWGQVIPKPR
jgi:hypothetical protein